MLHVASIHQPSSRLITATENTLRIRQPYRILRNFRLTHPVASHSMESTNHRNPDALTRRLQARTTHHLTARRRAHDDPHAVRRSSLEGRRARLALQHWQVARGRPPAAK